MWWWPYGTDAAAGRLDLHLIRGMLGRPGCGVLQMNGQPTAQNTRACGANGNLPGFRNWDAPDGAGHHRAANELTPTSWDPASKQPLFKTGATRITPASALAGTDGHGLRARARSDRPERRQYRRDSGMKVPAPHGLRLPAPRTVHSPGP